MVSCPAKSGSSRARKVSSEATGRSPAIVPENASCRSITMAREEWKEMPQKFVRILLRNAMAGVDRRAGNVPAPLSPRFKRRGRFVGNAGTAPERKRRTADHCSLRAVFIVSGEVIGGAGTVIVAGRVNMLG